MIVIQYDYESVLEVVQRIQQLCGERVIKGWLDAFESCGYILQEARQMPVDGNGYTGPEPVKIVVYGIQGDPCDREI